MLSTGETAEVGVRMQVLWLGALACAGGQGDDADDTGPTGTSGDDTSPVIQTADTGPARDLFDLAGTLEVRAGAGVEGDVVVGLVAARVADAVTIEETWLHVPVAVQEGQAVPFTLALPEVSPDQLSPADDDAPDDNIATFLVAAWEDDGDGLYQAGERAVALYREILVFSTEPPGEFILSAGGDAGWNLVELVASDAGASARPIADGEEQIALISNLVPADPGALPAVLAPELERPTADVDVRHVGPVLRDRLPPQPTVRTTDVVPMGSDQPFEIPAGWTAPPSAHLSTSLFQSGDGVLPGVLLDPDGDPLLTAGVYGLVAYADRNGSGALDVGEPVDARSVTQPTDRLVAYVLPRGLAGAMPLLSFGFEAGWQLVEVDEDGFRRVGWSEGVTLRRAR